MSHRTPQAPRLTSGRALSIKCHTYHPHKYQAQSAGCSCKTHTTRCGHHKPYSTANLITAAQKDKNLMFQHTQGKYRSWSTRHISKLNAGATAEHGIVSLICMCQQSVFLTTTGHLYAVLHQVNSST